jgi:eukaryotic-like serine/threonine-protein kinase
MHILEEINRGGFGIVEKVRLDNGSFAARKSFSPAFTVSVAEMEKLKKRFRREVRVQKGLNLAGVIPIIGESLEGVSPWFLMPLADKNFQTEIEEAREKGLAPQQGLADILNALEELHQLGYVHRDLKPQNILLHDQIWKLTDFGLVLPPSGTTSRFTSPDSNWGTLNYCAPEQAIEFRNATPAVDIYSFGCILHDIYGNAPRVPYQRYTVPGPIGPIIEKCTELKPDKRFKSVQALRNTLLTLLANVGAVAISPTANEWIDALPSLPGWSKEKLESFVRYLISSPGREEEFAIFKALDDDFFRFVFNMDRDIGKTIALLYTDWAGSWGFNFEYCDVVVTRLELIFSLGDLECKASVAISAAELGKSHNRWFVMRRLFEMCGPSLEDLAAQRIAIEIRAEEAEENFRRCADAIGHSYTDFHPHIESVIK